MLTYHSFTQSALHTSCVFFICYTLTLTIIQIQSCWFSLSISLYPYLSVSRWFNGFYANRIGRNTTMDFKWCSCIKRAHYSQFFFLSTLNKAYLNMVFFLLLFLLSHPISHIHILYKRLLKAGCTPMWKLQISFHWKSESFEIVNSIFFSSV